MTDTTYVAAWPDKFSCTLLEIAGVTKRVHMTTCFEKSGKLVGTPPPPQFRGPLAASIIGLEEWTTKKGRHVVAILGNCTWAHHINDWYADNGVARKQRYRPHLTLAKSVQPGAAKQFLFLIGYDITFDRHGFE